jgi:hypothetical protein
MLSKLSLKKIKTPLNPDEFDNAIRFIKIRKLVHTGIMGKTIEPAISL